MIWSRLSEEQRDEIKYKFSNGTSIADLARDYDIKATSLARKMRLLRSRGELLTPSESSFRVRKIQVEESLRVFVYSDLHAGNHDSRAMQAALLVAGWWQPDMIVNLGDTLDGDRASSFRSQASANTAQEERDYWAEFAEELNECTNAEKRYILEGNHDRRYISAVIDSDWMEGIEELSLDSLLYLDDLGYESICDIIAFNSSGDDLYLDAMLYALHGTVARKWSGSSARGQAEKFADASLMMGHAHRSSITTRRTDRGIIKRYEVGTLGTLMPTYDLLPDWSQSVLVGTIGADFFDFQLVMIDRGRVAIEGKVYQV